MRSKPLDFGLALFAVGCLLLFALVFSGSSAQPEPVPQPAPSVPAPPVPPVTPEPAPEPPVCPEPNCPNCPRPKPHGPWGRPDAQPVRLACYAVEDGIEAGVVHDGPAHNGVEVTCDLPADQLVRNCGGRDGSGLCVFTSIMFSARFQNEARLKDFQAKMKAEPGGGYPSKVDRMIEKYGKGTPYVQYEGKDPSILQLALKTGRMPAITYGSAHMTSLVGWSGDSVAVRDNNAVGEREIYWMDSRTFMQKWLQGGSGWTVILLQPRPPAPPHNANRPGPLPRSSFAAHCPALAAPLLSGRYEWRAFADVPQWALWRDGRQVGCWDAEGDYYREFDAGAWGRDWRRPPVALPEEAAERLHQPIAGGVVREGLTGRECYSVCGHEVPASTALAVVAGGTVPDDSAKPSLTIIGPAADRQRVLADVNSSAFEGLRQRVLVQDYEPTDWAVSRYGFVTSGKPTIYLQRPDGTVLTRLDSYAGPESLRKIDPSYNPSLDPNPNASPALPGPLKGVPSDDVAVAGFAGLAVLAAAGYSVLRR